MKLKKHVKVNIKQLELFSGEYLTKKHSFNSASLKGYTLGSSDFALEKSFRIIVQDDNAEGTFYNFEEKRIKFGEYIETLGAHLDTIRQEFQRMDESIAEKLAQGVELSDREKTYRK